jgi:hypothetical protein
MIAMGTKAKIILVMIAILVCAILIAAANIDIYAT